MVEKAFSWSFLSRPHPHPTPRKTVRETAGPVWTPGLGVPTWLLSSHPPIAILSTQLAQLFAETASETPPFAPTDHCSLHTTPWSPSPSIPSYLPPLVHKSQALVVYQADPETSLWHKGSSQLVFPSHLPFLGSYLPGGRTEWSERWYRPWAPRQVTGFCGCLQFGPLRDAAYPCGPAPSC